MLAILVVMLTSSNQASGQTGTSGQQPDSFIHQQRALDERLRRQFDAESDPSGRTLFDWGGWYSSFLFVFDDGVESSRTLRRHDLRLWGRLTLDEGAHEFYARSRLGLLDFNSGDAYDGNDDDIEGPKLERGFYQFDLARWRRARDRGPLSYNVVLKGGRDLVQFGSGLALSLPLDHVSVKATYRMFELAGFWGKTVGSMQDVDLSRSAKRSQRNFYGAQLTYRGFERHRPYVYAFGQRDRNHEVLFRPLQRFDYDSFYFGVGSSGELMQNLLYSTELVYEFGESFGHSQFLAHNDIHAWAANAEVEYLFPGPHKTRASLEFLFGSGDGGRFGSPTNSIGGNLGDRTDTSFVGFGFKDTGLSFAPTVSNLQMWRGGASFFPWPEDRRFRNLRVGADYYLYYKHHRDGAVSDPTATRRSGYLGWEMDYFANWRVTADLAWTARVGMFFPGPAFGDRTTRTFVLVGIVWSF